MKEQLVIQSNIFTQYRAKSRMFQGHKQLIVPVVMMVEGVHNGSHGPLLHLAEDLGMFPGAWNGIPITVSHPISEGVNISANENPETAEKVTVGRVFNTHMDGKKLKAEAYIDEQKLSQVSPVALAYIKQDRPLDVSIGVFTEEEQTAGEYNGEVYSAIARHHRPDHLALLPGEQGACSWADGCGVRVNSEKDKTTNKIETNEKVKKMTEEEIAAEKQAIMNRLVANSITANAAKGFRDLLDRVSSLVNSMDSPTEVFYLEEVFDGYFIYRKRVRNNTNNSGITEEILLQQSYIVGADGAIDLQGNPSKVKKEVTYTVINNNNESHKMVRTKPVKQMENNSKSTCFLGKIEKLTANKAYGFQSDDKEWLMNLEESSLDKLLARPVDVPAPPQANAEQVLQVFKNSVKTPEEFIALAPVEMQESMRNGLALHTANKANLVTKIMDNAKGIYTKEELEAMSFPSLEKIGKLIPTPVDYSANGGGAPLNLNANGEEPLYPAGIKMEQSK